MPRKSIFMDVTVARGFMPDGTVRECTDTVVTLAARNDYENPADCVIPYCDIYYNIPFERNPLKPGNLKAYKELKHIIDEGEYDIVHCHTPVGAMLTRLAAKQARRNSKIFHVNQDGLSQSLALAFNQTCILFQLEHQAAGLLVGTAQGLHDFLGGEDDVDPALFIQPVILDRQAHAVQQDTVQDLCIGGQRFELRVGEQHLGDAIE